MLKQLLTCIAIAAAPLQAHAGDVLIDFDTFPGGTVIPSGTIVNTAYQVWGVTLRHVGADGCQAGIDAFASNQCVPDGLLGNIVTPCGGGSCSDTNESFFGLIEAEFSSLTPLVCVDFIGANATGRGVLRAYDANGVLAGENLSDPGGGQICMEIQTGIKRVQFAGFETDFGWCDNLRFTAISTPVAGAQWGKVKSLYRN